LEAQQALIPERPTIMAELRRMAEGEGK